MKKTIQVKIDNQNRCRITITGGDAYVRRVFNHLIEEIYGNEFSSTIFANIEKETPPKEGVEIKNLSTKDKKEEEK